MRVSAVLSVLAGLAIVIGLVMANGVAGIGAGIAATGWGIVPVIAIHLPQVFCSALGWRALASGSRTPSWRAFFGLRLIREGVNALLPVAQIGGHLVGARLLAQAGVPLSVAGAGVAADLTLEMLSQVVFTVLGVGLLAAGSQTAGLSGHMAGGVLAAIAILTAVFVVAQRFGLFRVLEGGLLRLAKRQNWKGLTGLTGLHLTIAAIYGSPRRLIVGGTYHFAAWLLGGFEVMVGLHVLGVPVGFRDATIIESLGQAFRAVGFAVPGGLGVQEGGVLLICTLLGIGPQTAIELSLLRRIRELALGVPALTAWYWIERPYASALASPHEDEPCRELTS